MVHLLNVLQSSTSFNCHIQALCHLQTHTLHFCSSLGLADGSLKLIRATRDSEKLRFFKKAQPTGFGGFYWVFRIFYLNDKLSSLSVDVAHQLSFYLDLPVL